MTRSGWLRRIRFSYPPSRALTGALVLLLVLTGSFQQALDDYARDLITRQSRDPAGALAEVDAATGDARYSLVDGLGTVRLQTDDAGTVTATADYDAYGDVRASSGSQANEGWAGERRDATTGLTHLRARDYDPLTGRFTTADTVSPNGAGTQGYNAYHYTGNNPTTRTDPSGHSWLDAMPEILRTLINLVVQMVETLRVIMQTDLPEWGKQFIAALIVFALEIVMTVIVVMLLVWIMESSGLGNTMIGRALVMARLHVLGKMSQFTKRCMGNQLCRNMARWIVQNPDCVLEAWSTLLAYGLTGAPQCHHPHGCGDGRDRRKLPRQRVH